jgi:hypothetical protein
MTSTNKLNNGRRANKKSTASSGSTRAMDWSLSRIEN